MENPNGSTKPAEPGNASTLNTASDADNLVESGWRHYSQKEYSQGIADFQKALELTPNNVDTLYALAMAQQAAGEKQESIETFTRVIHLLEDPQQGIDHTRALMLGRLARGHISRMQTGDWQLNK